MKSVPFSGERHKVAGSVADGLQWVKHIQMVFSFKPKQSASSEKISLNPLLSTTAHCISPPRSADMKPY